MPAAVPPPGSEEELLRRAAALTGLTAGELARRLGRRLPGDTVRAKGSIGALLEQALGATAGSRDQPDFPGLGVELKTVPLDAAGRVRESTFVCALDLSRVDREEWAGSRVWRKLRRVLWMPVEAAGVGPPAARHLGRPLLWSPSAEEQAVLRADWMELTGRLAVGGVEELSAHLGQALQLRPKARDGSVRVEVPGPEGEPLPAVPMGFYLRARFTERVLWEHS
jgi:DNA mismatch repair protein MutH